MSTLNIAVLVTLYHTAGAGGHVKAWERFAEAAERFADRVALTIYFMGPTPDTVTRGGAVRFRHLRPRLGTDKLPFLGQGAGHTDLAGFHPVLAQELPNYDLVVSTDIFSFGRTAERVCREADVPLVHSIHTDVVYFTRLYSVEIIKRLLGRRAGGWIVDRFDLGHQFAKGIEKRLETHIRLSDHVIVSRPPDQAMVETVAPGKPVSVLRRGVDLELFHPSKRDRAALSEQYGIPADRPICVFAGRVDASKGAMIAVRAVNRLLEAGRDVHMLIAGEGEDLPAARHLLGSHVTTPGVVPQAELALLYASSDVFVFPSESETVGNVVLEAKASGLPIAVSGRPIGCGRFVAANGADGVAIDSDDAALWADAVGQLLDRDRGEMGRAARHAMETGGFAWDDIFETDLLAVWERIAQEHKDQRNSSA